MSQHLESIQRFSPDADEQTVEHIIKHLGIAMHSADGATVAVSEQSELDRIRDGFCANHLDLTPDKADLLINEVCETMKHDGAKSRVTFYYLLAEKAGKLDIFA